MEWIKCTDQLPNHNQKVLTYSEYIDIKYFEQGAKDFIFYDGETHCYCPVGEIKDVTYWMPMPLPPKS